MKQFYLLVLPLLVVSSSLMATDLQPSSPRFSAEQILNGEFPGREPSPARQVTHKIEGFDYSRLYSVPSPGIHPRVLFGPEDLPRIRKQFLNNQYAAEMLEQLRARTERNLSGPDGWGSELFAAMASSDLDKVNEVWKDPRNPRKEGPPGSGGDPFAAALMDKAFLNLIDEDSESGAEVAGATATLARFLQPLVEKAARSPGSENYWLSVRRVMGDSATIGFLYDFAQPYMTSEQADVTRKLIATAVSGRYGLGMDLPAHWVNWNFIGMGLYFPLLALSIEGEPGYDPRIYERGCDVAKNYILWGNSANGVGTEAIGYHTAGMSHTAILMLAMANRGENLFTLERWRRMFDTWGIYTMQPYGAEWQSSGDLGTFPPNPSLVSVACFFFPEDKRIAFVEQNLEKPRLAGRMDNRLLQLLCPPNPNGDFGTIKASSLGLADTLFDEERGILFTRTGWDEEDTYLQVVCRDDTTFASHDHPDRGAFYFTSHGQAWAVSSMRMTEPQYLNQITINGRGQGAFAPPGEWVEVIDSEEATFAVMDTKYCYDWQWQKTAFLTSDKQLEDEPWLEWIREPRDRLLSRFPLDLWERDPLPVVQEYYEGYLAGNPRMWGAEDSWVVRAPHNPVKKAFRTVGLVRGEHPYLLIFDDIQKDDAEQFYQWFMRIPNQVEPYEMGVDEVILGPITDRRDNSHRVHLPHNISGRPLPEKGEPMLLIRVLQANQPDIPSRQNTLSVETLNFVKHDDTFQYSGREMGLGKRLVIPSRSVEPEYKVLMYPYYHGDPLPETELSKDGSVLTIQWEDQVDEFRLAEDEEGLTRFEMTRLDPTR
ncbi:MAG: hypothetical protein AAGJ81_09280 [Verrucomicrobiota bacterium]